MTELSEILKLADNVTTIVVVYMILRHIERVAQPVINDGLVLKIKRDKT